MNNSMILIEAVVDRELREQAESILKQLGETPSMAITHFQSGAEPAALFSLV